MEFVSAMAQGWLDFRLLTIQKASNFNDLDFFSVTANNEIEMLYREELIDLDEREWAVRAINEAVNTRAAEVTGGKL